jgi:thiol-disulfide isomerase/thioredoxin
MTGSSHVTERVAEMRAAMAAQGPGPTGGAFARDRADLAAGGVPARVVPPGAVLPGAELLDVHGAAITLEAVRSGGTSVLVFYRGSWCPYCNIALLAYQTDWSLTMQEKNSLTFAVVSDSGNGIGRRLGILMWPSGEAVRAAELPVGVDLTSLNADGTRTEPR